MKKIIIRFLLSIVFLAPFGGCGLFAQITISGSTTYPALNLTFNQSSIIPYSNCYILSDAGTNLYKASVYVPPVSGVPGYNIDYYIIRRSNRWFIEGFNYLNSTYPSYYVYYESQISTDINPPCNDIWRIWSGYCVPLGGFSLTPTGTNISTLILSGLCVSVPTVSTTICPNVLQLPQQTTAQILAIPSPKKGMIVFDVSTNTIKVYNGAAWKTVSVL